MMNMQRNNAPDFLAKNWKAWTKEDIDQGRTVAYWHKKQEDILNALKQLTDNHCAFCDDLLHPFSADKGQIEHFRPYATCKAFAYAWGNLYPICVRCNQTKGDRFDSTLLRPDAKNFEFEQWFRLDINTFELKPVKLGNPDWQRAQTTIKIYGLNKEDKKQRREVEFDNIKKGSYSEIKNQPFRFMSQKDKT